MLFPGVPAHDAARYAADIAAVTQDRDEQLALVVTQAGESSFRRDVERCHVRGKLGEVSSFQLRPTTISPATLKRVCRNNRFAASVALERLREGARRLGTWRATLAGYVGKLKAHDSRGKKRLAWWDKLQREIPLED